jgi:hypothetical protein
MRLSQLERRLDAIKARRSCVERVLLVVSSPPTRPVAADVVIVTGVPQSVNRFTDSLALST